MNISSELANKIYQGAEMGVSSIKKVLEMTPESEISDHLRIQHAEYQKISDEAAQYLHAQGKEEKDINIMAKIGSDISVRMNTLIDKTSSHIAEMMMQGSLMGVIEGIRNLKNYTDADPKLLNLQQRLLETEQANIDQLKQFL